MSLPPGLIGRVQGGKLPVLADFTNCIDLGLIIRFEEPLRLRRKTFTGDVIFHPVGRAVNPYRAQRHFFRGTLLLFSPHGHRQDMQVIIEVVLTHNQKSTERIDIFDAAMFYQ